MNVLQAVLLDLWHFAISGGSVNECELTTPHNELSTATNASVVAEYKSHLKTAASQLKTPVESITSVHLTPKETQVVEDDTLTTNLLPLEKTEVAAADGRVGVVTTPEAPLMVMPTIMFDGVICRLPSGTAVTVLNTQGRFVRVRFEKQEGWVMKDDLFITKHISPLQLVPGEHYAADAPETIQLRTMIHDSFGGLIASVDLQGVEYVTYALLDKQREIAWPAMRPRTAGRWKDILKGVPGIHISVFPKTEAVMEHMSDNETGQVAFVTAVYPDSSIAISEVDQDSIYQERVLQKEDWMSLQPVFIEVA